VAFRRHSATPACSGLIRTVRTVRFSAVRVISVRSPTTGTFPADVVVAYTSPIDNVVLSVAFYVGKFFDECLPDEIFGFRPYIRLAGEFDAYGVLVYKLRSYLSGTWPAYTGGLIIGKMYWLRPVHPLNGKKTENGPRPYRNCVA